MNEFKIPDMEDIHKYANSVIEEIEKNLNNKYLLVKDPSPGNIYHTPVILRNFFEENISNIEEVNNESELLTEPFLMPVCGAVKDATCKAKFLKTRTLIGYSGFHRSYSDRNLDTFAIPLIKNVTLDILDKHNYEFYQNIPFIGQYFIKFIKDESGNYFHELPNSAAFMLKIVSNCALRPPDIIDCKTFNKEIAKQWSIKL